MTLDELQQALRRVIGIELPMSEPRWMTRATDTSRQAERYRDRRVLLAGDAAHVHFACGGMGSSNRPAGCGEPRVEVGRTDSWLGASGFLDTYDTERQPVGRRVLMATRAAPSHARPGVYVSALREMVQRIGAIELMWSRPAAMSEPPPPMPF
jgi:hypothetical protein